MDCELPVSLVVRRASSDAERPENRTCFSMPDSIRSVFSSPSSINTTNASRGRSTFPLVFSWIVPRYGHSPDALYALRAVRALAVLIETQFNPPVMACRSGNRPREKPLPKRTLSAVLRVCRRPLHMHCFQVGGSAALFGDSIAVTRACAARTVSPGCLQEPARTCLRHAPAVAA